YDERDVERVERSWKHVSYRDRTEILPHVFVTWMQAGHILGSSFLFVEADGARVVMSGDVGHDTMPLLPGTEALPSNLDLIVCESTYGNRLHIQDNNRLDELRVFIERVATRGGTLMIPAFSVERTQELLFDLNTLAEREHVNLGSVFLDSPLGIGATDVYAAYRDNPAFVRPQTFHDDDYFQFPELVVTRSVPDSKHINDAKAPKIIVAGAGMMDSGRIKHHLLRYLSDARNGLLIVGYQAEGTLGRQIQKGVSPVTIFDYAVDVRAEIVTTDRYSAHADYDKLTHWIKSAGVAHVVLVHGDTEAQDAFAAHLTRQGIAHVDIPTFGEWLTVSL
ncbi:MBL fold metallo-hydrolase, partial [Candidatus Uhrbacteria bacterium]|nr:MBL fold metallo-hydrolase [Candidatus Uhrbacteria bacterium]